MVTDKQKLIIKDLCRQLGYDFEEYDFDNMTAAQASEIIGEMLEERG